MLTILMPGDAALPQSAGDRPIPIEGPAITGLLVTMDRLNRQFLAQPVEHRAGLSFTYDQRLPELAQAPVQITQAGANETPVPTTGIRLIPIARLHDIQWQHGPILCCLAERDMIIDAKITFEPDQVYRGGHCGSPCTYCR